MIEDLLQWSQENYSHLPWRRKRSLYHTLVSEIMLQQTTVGTVLSHFERFLERYPTIESLAATSEEELTIQWKGLGYYRRARNLLRSAQCIVKNYKGEIPLDAEILKTIPGIGVYTAHALLSIGAGEKFLCIDANLERVLSRLYLIKEDSGTKLQKSLYEKFEKGVILPDIPNDQFRQLNESLMDLGRTLCQARKTSCLTCPMNDGCLAFKQGKQDLFPAKKPKIIKKLYGLSLLRVVVKDNDNYLVYRKRKDKWLSGQLEFPTFVISSEDESLAQYPVFKKKIDISSLRQIKGGITKYKIINYIYPLTLVEFRREFPQDEDYFFESFSSNKNFAMNVFKTLS